MSSTIYLLWYFFESVVYIIMEFYFLHCHTSFFIYSKSNEHKQKLISKKILRCNLPLFRLAFV